MFGASISSGDQTEDEGVRNSSLNFASPISLFGSSPRNSIEKQFCLNLKMPKDSQTQLEKTRLVSAHEKADYLWYHYDAPASEQSFNDFPVIEDTQWVITPLAITQGMKATRKEPGTSKKDKLDPFCDIAPVTSHATQKRRCESMISEESTNLLNAS